MPLPVCCVVSANKRYNGFYKGVQSAGAAVAWQVDTHKVPFLNQLLANWALTTISYPLLVVLLLLAVKDDDDSSTGEENDPAQKSGPSLASDDTDTAQKSGPSLAADDTETGKST